VRELALVFIPSTHQLRLGEPFAMKVVTFATGLVSRERRVDNGHPLACAASARLPVDYIR
jgi:hypothetical protein